MDSEKTRENERTEAVVTVRVFGGLREHVGRMPLLVEARDVLTVDALLSRLDTTHPKLSEALRAGLRDGYLNILVNGRNVRFLASCETPLHAGDAVAFLPPIGGG